MQFYQLEIVLDKETDEIKLKQSIVIGSMGTDGEIVITKEMIPGVINELNKILKGE